MQRLAVDFVDDLARVGQSRNSAHSQPPCAVADLLRPRQEGLMVRRKRGAQEGQTK